MNPLTYYILQFKAEWLFFQKGGFYILIFSDDLIDDIYFFENH